MFERVGVSKDIGWDGPLLDIPEMGEVEKIFSKSCNGCYMSAREIFRWYRFCKSPESNSEVDVMNRITACFQVLF